MINYKYLENNKVQLKGVIHVGAHRGEELAEHVALGAKKIVWIEANPEVYPELLVTLEKSSAVENIPFNALCLDVDDKEVEFHLVYSPHAGYFKGNKGSSSILEPLSWMRNRWLRRRHNRSLKLKTVKLDTLLERNSLVFEDYDLLELDTQGSELLVLKGAEKVLEVVDYISIEVTYKDALYKDNPLFEEVNRFLEGKGFVYIEINFPVGILNWGDALYKK